MPKPPQVLPARNLGQAEPWGRSIEKRAQEQDKNLAQLRQQQDNQERSAASTASTIAAMNNTILALQRQSTQLEGQLENAQNQIGELTKTLRSLAMPTVLISNTSGSSSGTAANTETTLQTWTMAPVTGRSNVVLYITATIRAFFPGTSHTGYIALKVNDQVVSSQSLSDLEGRQVVPVHLSHRVADYSPGGPVNYELVLMESASFSSVTHQLSAQAIYY